MDQHSKRSAVNQSQIRGDGPDNLVTSGLSGTARVVQSFSPKLVRIYGSSPQGQVRMLDDLRSKFFDPVENKLKRKGGDLVNPANKAGVKAAIAIRLMEVDGDAGLTARIKEFVDVLEERRCANDENSAAVALIETLGAKRVAHGKEIGYTDREVFILTLKALSKFIEREKVNTSRAIRLSKTDLEVYAKSIGLNPEDFGAQSKKAVQLADDEKAETRDGAS